MAGTKQRAWIVVAAALALVVVGVIGGSMAVDRASTPDAGADGDIADTKDLAARSATEEELEQLRSEGDPAELGTLSSLAALRTRFNDNAGTPRVVALLSPSCVTCLRGAHWLQQQLAQHPGADIEVYAVWEPLLPGDDVESWDPYVLNDPRVEHFWDEQQVSGRWFSEQGYGDLPVQWDALFVYGAESEWTDDGAPTGLIEWNRPIMAFTDDLEAALTPLLTG